MPFTRYVFSFGRWPPSESWLPKPRLPLLAENPVVAWFGTDSTPGSRVAREVQSRPFRGSSRTVVPSTVALSVEEEDWTEGGATETTTVWSILPTVRTGLKVCWALTVSTMPFCKVVENPLAEILTV